MAKIGNIDQLADELVDEILEEEIPRWNQVVYHYTNAAGLLGILESGKIIATDINFLNDKTELSFGIDRAILACTRMTEKAKSKERVEFLNALCSSLRAPYASRSFVTSFSSRKDDLSQWRGYANDGEGFTLGFSSLELRRIGNTPDDRYGFGKVSYSVLDFDKKLSNAVSRYLSIIKSESKSEDLSKWVADAAGACDAFTGVIASFLKHRSFQNEREWRINYNHLNDQSTKIKIRNRRNNLVPYIEIDLRNAQGVMPLREVGIGPGFSNPSTKRAVIDACSSAGYEVNIYSANTPYVRR